MYQSFFGLSGVPFAATSDPSCFYLSTPHAEVLAYIVHGVAGGGVVMLAGEPGTGKTTLSKYIQQHPPEHVDVIRFVAPLPEGPKFYAMLLQTFDPNFNLGKCDVCSFELVRDYVFGNRDRKRTVLLMIDEAQHLSADELSQLCVLTEVKNENNCLLQVMLIGTKAKLEVTTSTLSQYVTARYNLLPLDREEVDAYIRFRLQIFGRVQPVFTRGAVDSLFRTSRGLPLTINRISERALLDAYTTSQTKVDAAIVSRAAREITGCPDRGSPLLRLSFYLACVIFCVGGWFSLQALELLPSPEVITVEVPIVLPPDSSQVDAFRSVVVNSRERNEAFKQLFNVWGYDVSPDSANCENVHRANLSCFSNSVMLDDLRVFNYPAVVRLEDIELGVWYAVLVRLEGEKAHLLLGGQEWAVSEDWLQQVWRPGSTIFWPSPEAESTFISQVSNARELTWLDAALSRALGTPARASVTVFDRTLVEKIKAFQEQVGLSVDGIAGARTLMKLTNVMADNVPRLDGVIPARASQLVTEDDDKS